MAIVTTHAIWESCLASSDFELKKHASVWEDISKNCNSTLFHLMYHEVSDEWYESFNPYLIGWNWDVLFLPLKATDSTTLERVENPLEHYRGTYVIKRSVAQRLLYWAKSSASIEDTFKKANLKISRIV